MRTTCIITTHATDEVALIHDRMPLLIHHRDVEAWLTGTPEEGQKLLRPAPFGSLRGWPVSRSVNRVQEEGAELIQPVLSAVQPPQGTP